MRKDNEKGAAWGIAKGVKNLSEWTTKDVDEWMDALVRYRMDLYERVVIYVKGRMEAASLRWPLDGASPQGKASLQDDGVTQRYRTDGDPFGCRMTEEQMAAVVEVIRAHRIFAQPERMTVEEWRALMAGRPLGTVKARNTRMLCELMTQLALHGLLVKPWQAPIYRLGLVMAPRKDRPLTRTDLTSATHKIWNARHHEGKKVIESQIKALSRTTGQKGGKIKG